MPDLGVTQQPAFDRAAASASSAGTTGAAPAPDSSAVGFGTHLLQLVELAPVAMCLCNADSSLAYYNGAAAALWRWSQPPPAWFMVDGEAVNPLASVLAGGPAVRDLDLCLRRGDGSVFDVCLRIDPVRDGAGTITGAVLTATSPEQERLRLPSHTGKVGIWDWDIVRDRISWSDSVFPLYGVSRQTFEPSLTGILALVHPDDVARVSEQVRLVLEDAQPFDLDYRVLRPGGEVAWLYTTASVVQAGGRPVRLAGASVDITERKRAELQLVESEERFRALAQHAPVGIFQTDPSVACIFVNEYWSRMVGMSPRQAMGAGWTQALFPGDRDRVLAAWEVARREHTRLAIEHRLIGANDALLWVQASAVEVRDATGSVLGFIGTAIDVTERKAAEFALRESEKRFRVVASRAPVGIFMTDPLGQNIYVNAAWCNLAGLAPNEAHGEGWFSAVHPDDRERVRNGWASAVQAGVSSKAEYRFIRPDGSITWVSGTAVQLRDASGRLTGYIGTIADFTERKHAELALRESESRFRMVADNIAQFAWVCDAAGRVTWVNRRFHDYTGLGPDELNRGEITLHHPEHGVDVRAKFAAHVASGEPWEDTFPLRSQDGTYRWFLSRAVPIRDESGEITRWFGTNTDVTEWRNTQEMLRKAQEELLAHATDLERKVEARTASLREAIVQMEEFSYSVSHDLRAPLRAMNGYAEALLEDYGSCLDDTGRDYLRRILRSSERMEKMTHDVLTYSRIARADVVPATVDLAAVVRDLVTQFSELQRGTAELVIDEPLLAVTGHELSVSQCLGNLLTNAVKFVPPGVKPRIRVYTTQAGGRVRLWVEDNGIGIAPALQSKLFQVFERLPTATPYEGTGIGLAIVRKAVERMGGCYGVESDGANGSRFWIELPSAQ